MRLATFTAGGEPQLGVIEDDRVVSLSSAAARLAGTMMDLIVRWDDVQREVREILRAPRAVFKRDAVRLLAPLQHPGKILAIGLNYADHIVESRMQRPEHQLWFAKMPTSINGPFDPIRIAKGSAAVDYEAELVAVVGRGGRYIDKSSAADAIFGYCVGNDVSERKWQSLTPQWTLGKSFDTHAPIGPWITTADEVPNPHTLALRCFVNGEKRQDSNTRDMLFDVWEQIEHLSQVMTLEPGDLIFTGTPRGVGAAMSPRQFLAAGDSVRVEIEKLGAIEARCVADEGAAA